jgi:hypothetical protein
VTVGKRHHYVPLFIIRCFADSAGKVFVADRGKPEVRFAKVEDVLVENHLYSTKKGGRADDRSLEADLGQLEGLAAPIVQKLVEQARSGVAPHLTPSEREMWDLFFSIQWRRVPELHRQHLTDAAFAASIDEIAEQFERDFRPMTAGELAFVEGAKRDPEFRHNVVVKSLRNQHGMVVNALSGRGLLLATPARPSKSFVLGSRPIVRAGGPEGATLEHPELEAWMTLAPDVAICYYGGVGDSYLNTLSDNDVRRLNRMVANQSRFMIAKDAALLQSLLRPR